MLTLNTIKEVVSRVGKKYGIKNAYLFCSYAKNTAIDTSDVDLIINRGEVHTYKDYYRLCQELEQELGTSVNITSEDGMFPGFYDLIKHDRICMIK